MKPRETSFVRVITTGSLLIVTSLVLTLAFVKGGRRWLLVFLGLMAATVITWFVIPYLHRKKMRVEWLLSIAFLILFLGVPELTLRITDFRYESGIEFGYPRPNDFELFTPDEKLFWRLNSSIPSINSQGFPGDEITVPKPSNVFRILFLGDSVTQQGYPNLIELFLNAKNTESPKRFESTVLAVSGYSSHQGRILAETYGSQYEPDLVIVYFGWNDHWQAYGSVDAKKSIKVSQTAWSPTSDFVYHNIRILQMLNRFTTWLRGSEQIPIGKERVPLEQYRANLLRIQEIFSENSVPVIFITAPTSYYVLGVPDQIVEDNFVLDKETAVRLHENYNEVVRGLAKSGSIYVLDLEAEINSMPVEDIRALFFDDGIHFTDYGLAVVAKRLAEYIENDVLFPDNSP